MRTYLTVEDVLFLHHDQIRRYGGSPGVRDPGQLAAAVYRPQSGYYADIVEEAAALWESLSQNHPFVDGNKRAAFAAMYTFLAMNLVEFLPEFEETWAFIGELYARNAFRYEAIEPWLRANTRAKA